MQPTKNRLLVRVKAEVVKKGEPAAAVMTAEVLKIGPEVEMIKVGDTVVFAPYGMDEVVVGKEKLLIVSEDLILAVHE